MDLIARQWINKHHINVEDVLFHEDSSYGATGPTKTSYSSKYYDYEKAHEYYEQHKQLKGRSKSSLNDEGKSIWEVSEHNINKAKEAEIASSNQSTEAQINQIKAAIEQLKNQSNTVRSEQKATVQARIESLRNALSQKRESLRTELQNKQTDIKNKNTKASETTRSNNERLSEEGKSKKEANSKKVSSYIEKMQGDIKKLGNTAQDAKAKEAIRSKIANMRNEKAIENAKISEVVAGAKKSNTTNLSKYRQSNAEEMSRYRASNASEVKQATNAVNSEIKNLRTGLSQFNTQNREELKSNLESHRNQIKTLREANRANRKALTEKYKEISNQEFDKIYEGHQAKKKKKSKR